MGHFHNFNILIHFKDFKLLLNSVVQFDRDNIVHANITFNNMENSMEVEVGTQERGNYQCLSFEDIWLDKKTIFTVFTLM